MEVVADVGQVRGVLDDFRHQRGAFLLSGKLELHEGFDDRQATDLPGEEIDFPGGHSDAVFPGDDFVHVAVEGRGGGRERRRTGLDGVGTTDSKSCEKRDG